ncbi:hypothetical protein C1704_09005 [Caldimonas caldifontis]|uniref:Uncharacterized protein n=1 Tax=Caldimonas caldifontis TaxID=1452508 RepID=A0A2S5SUN4_9BURK|nr:hypothetical protein C1704_09005 [Caldimonas caldifontis]
MHGHTARAGSALCLGLGHALGHRRGGAALALGRLGGGAGGARPRCGAGVGGAGLAPLPTGA